MECIEEKSLPPVLVFKIDLCHVRAMSAETVIFTRPPGLDGVDLLHARYTRHVFSRHSHDGYALGLIEDGALRFNYQHRDHTAAPGDINLVVPGETHDGRGANEHGWAYRMLYLDPVLVRKAATGLHAPSGLPDFSGGVLHDPELAHLIHKAHVYLARPDSTLLQKDSLLLRLLTLWIHRHAQKCGTIPRMGTEHQAVRRAKEYLKAQCNHNPRLENLAQAVGLSPFHLLRVFARATGQTPHEFLIQQRVDKARHLLASTLPLARIAADCGFSDQSHMTRLFRRQHGLTPGNYRKIVLNRNEDRR